MKKNRHICDGFFSLISFIHLLLLTATAFIATFVATGAVAFYVLLVDAIVEVE